MSWLRDLSIIDSTFLVGVGLVAAVLFGLAFAVRRRHGLRWLFVGLGSFMALVLIAGVVNARYAYKRTLGEAFGQAGGNVVSQDELAHEAGCDQVPSEGQITQIDIPNTASGFEAVPAWIYLPPSWCRGDGTTYPVVLLLHGNPGTTKDWIDGGEANKAADAFAAQHDGKAPVLVFPDTGGASDTECVDSAKYGKVETYLTQDVPDFVRTWETTKGRVATTPDDWAIGGFSMGATCSIMLTLRHPDTFHTFADFGGDYFGIGEDISEQQQEAETVPDLFGGDKAAFEAHDPEELMKQPQPADLGGWFGVGSEDQPVVEHLRDYAKQAEGAGLTVCWNEVSGEAHTFQAFSKAFAAALPWLAVRTGLIDATPEIDASCAKP